MMEEIMDDDLFLGLLAANPRGSHAPAKTEPAVHAEPWHDNMQSDGLHNFLTATTAGSFGSAATGHKPAMWTAAPTSSWNRTVPFSRSPPAQEFMALPTKRDSTRSHERGELSTHASGRGSHTSSTARSLMHTTSTARSHASTLPALEEPPRGGTTGWAGWLPELSRTDGYPVYAAAVDLTAAPAPATESPQSSGDNPGSSGRRRSQQGNSSGSPCAAQQAGKSFKEVHAERNKQAQRRFRQRQKDKIEELQNKLNGLQGERSQMLSRSHMLASALQLRKEELRKLRERQAAAVDADEAELAREFSGSVTLTVHEQEEVTLSPDQIKGMKDKDLARLWSQYVKELAVLLVRAEGGDPAPEVAARVQDLVQRELLLLYIRAALTNMSNVKRFIARARLEDGRIPVADEGIKMWRGVAESLQLTPDQAAHTAQLWHSFRSKLEELFAKRKACHQGIAASMPTGVMGQDFAVQYIKASELMESLKKNLRQEHVLIHDFLSTFYTQMLTPLQMARCVVKSYPWYPDIPGIACWVSAMNGDTAAQTQLQMLLPSAQF